MKYFELKYRLIISLIVGLMGIVAYAIVLYANGFQIDLYNLFIFLFILPTIFLKLFLYSFLFTFFCLTIIVTIKNRTNNSQKIQSLLLMVLIVVIIVYEYKGIQKNRLFKDTFETTLPAKEINIFYNKAIKENDVPVLTNIAGQENLPDSLENILSESVYFEVRRAIAWKSDNANILQRLSQDKEYEVRMAVATNKLTPIEIVITLKNDSNEYVRNTAYSMYMARKDK